MAHDDYLETLELCAAAAMEPSCWGIMLRLFCSLDVDDANFAAAIFHAPRFSE